MDKAIDDEMRQGKTDPYDTHPPLALRIAAVQDLPAAATLAGETSAIGLLEDLPTLEQKLLITIAGAERAGRLTEATWEDVGAAVYLPLWRRAASDRKRQLHGLTPEQLREKLVPRLKGPGADLPEEEGRRVVTAVGAALTVAAVNAGAVLVCDIGSAIAVVAGELTVETFSVVDRLANGQLGTEEWQGQCAALGIVGVDLAAVGGDDDRVDPALRDLAAQSARR